MPHNPLGALPIGPLGEYIREQRRNAQYSVRQLAQAAGVSNPYLSQIERGLRKPSAEILQQLAKALRISAETLYVRAGLLDGGADVDEDAATDGSGVRTAITDDPWLSARQKRALLDIYEAFRIESARDAAQAVPDSQDDDNDETIHGPANSGPTEQ
ncbi:transcriptional regulator with XRE-family HTH domain [Catenulispora sp. MAP12-49]|jgi:transcriptional regulator with XRE-family HTH domain|uniref:helix-turn-helix domain-containing protein n=1 Tax=unclassified Catenulispora TaxID=414885 RepID=UPI0035143868